MQKEQAAAVKAGIFVVTGITLVIVVITALGQRKQLFAEQYTLTATFRNAAGLIKGAAVRVAGVNAGTVRDIRIIRGPGNAGVVEVVMDINVIYQPMIREGSRASVRTIGALGDKYVEISLGSLDAPALASGSRLASDEVVDFYEVAEEVRDTFRRANIIASDIAEALAEVEKAGLINNIHELSTALRRFLERVEKGPSLLHSLLFDTELPRIFEDIRAAAKSLRAVAESANSGKGPLSRLVQDEALSKAMDDIAAAASSARNILKEIENGSGAAHALIYGQEERQALAELRAAAEKLNAVMTQIQEARGTLGLMVQDPAPWESLERILGTAEESRTLRLLINRAAGK